jgi:hypothetical protein
MAQLCCETLKSSICEVYLTRESFFELNVSSLLLAAIEGRLKSGPIRAHIDRYSWCGFSSHNIGIEVY